MRDPIVGILFASALLLPPTSAVAQAQSRPPNIVVIMLDDQRWDTLDSTHAMGPNRPVMPLVMDELAAEGVTFTNAYTTTALCAPSRAGFLTGQYASTHGLRGNGEDLFWDHQKAVLEPTMLPVWLQSKNYRTALVGKYSNGYRNFDEPDVPPRVRYVPPGWTDWHALAGQGQYRDFSLCERQADGSVACPVNNQDYSTYVLRDRAVDFILDAAPQSETRPFFLLFTPKAPHGRGGDGPHSSEAEPACGDDSFRDEPDWRPAGTYNEPDVSDKPDWLSDHTPQLILSERRALDRVRQQALDTLKSVGGPPASTGCPLAEQDRALQAIMNTLRTTSVNGRLLIDDTVVIYTSDNGYFWGEHRLQDKTAPYEEAVRVPLVIRPAGGTTPRTETSLVLNIDLTATIVDLADLTPTRHVQGRSLKPFLDGVPPSPAWRTQFLIEAWGGNTSGPDMPTYAGVKSSAYKYVEYVTGEQEYYPASDRYELDNVASTHPGVAAAQRCQREFRPQFPSGIPADFVFSSSFECGDLTGWSPTPAHPNVTVTGEAALAGSVLGLKVVIDDDQVPLSIQDDSPHDEREYRAGFHFKPNDFTPATGTAQKEVTLFIAGEEPSRRLVTIVLKKTDAQFALLAKVRKEDGTTLDFGPFDISDAAHQVEFEWRKANGTAADGYFRLWIDGLDPDTDPLQPPRSHGNDIATGEHTVDFARLGAMSLHDGAQGTLYFDAFVSRRSIGP